MGERGRESYIPVRPGSLLIRSARRVAGRAGQWAAADWWGPTGTGHPSGRGAPAPPQLPPPGLELPHDTVTQALWLGHRRHLSIKNRCGSDFGKRLHAHTYIYFHMVEKKQFIEIWAQPG